MNMESYEEFTERIKHQKRTRSLEDKLERVIKLFQRKDSYAHKRIREQDKRILNLMMKVEVLTLLLSQETEFYTEKVELILEELQK